MSQRLDLMLTKLGHSQSRNKAQQLIESGLVFVDGKVASKPSMKINDGQTIVVKPHKEYVSRGAYKLLCAIQNFDIDLGGKVLLDVGASTGGFTQVALESGAAKVYAVDVGDSQLDPSLKADARVVNLAGTDIRTLTRQQAPDVNFFTCDLSFVSLDKILPTLFENFGALEGVALFKPQFECGKDIAKRYKGIIKDAAVHQSLLKNFVLTLNQRGIKVSGLTFSSIRGGDGNIEYLFHLNGQNSCRPDIEKVVKSAFESLK